MNITPKNEATGVASLNSITVENIEINIPLLTEQTTIAEILSDMDTEARPLRYVAEHAIIVVGENEHDFRRSIWWKYKLSYCH